MFYKLKSVNAEAFQFSPDAEIVGPKWFGKAIEKETIIIDRAMRDGAIYVRGCSIKFNGGWIHAKTGDYIVRLISGDIFVVSKKKFQKLFDKL